MLEIEILKFSLNIKLKSYCSNVVAVAQRSSLPVSNNIVPII